MGRKSNFIEYIRKLKAYYFIHRSIPSFETVAELLGVGSKRTVHRFFQECLTQEYLYKQDNNYYPTKKLSGLPMFTSVPAGSPQDNSEEKLADINLVEELTHNPLDTVILKAQGDSMEDAGIFSGDMMIVDTQKQHHQGDIVIGVVDNEYTVKYLEKDTENKRYLKAANTIKNYKPIYADTELSIYGVVTGIIRKYH